MRSNEIKAVISERIMDEKIRFFDKLMGESGTTSTLMEQYPQYKELIEDVISSVLYNACVTADAIIKYEKMMLALELLDSDTEDKLNKLTAKNMLDNLISSSLVTTEPQMTEGEISEFEQLKDEYKNNLTDMFQTSSLKELINKYTKLYFSMLQDIVTYNIDAIDLANIEEYIDSLDENDIKAQIDKIDNNNEGD